MNIDRHLPTIDSAFVPRIAALIASVLLPAVAPIAQAADSLSADEIAAAISDRTYQGSMTVDAFAEYYAEDGTVRGDGYTGQWRSEDDALCLAYEGGDEQCWGVLINGPAMTLLIDGEVDGSGMLVDGNPLGF